MTSHAPPRQSYLQRGGAILWWGEQKAATVLAVVAGTIVGLALGALHVTRALVPHLTSKAGIRRLYNGEAASRPAAATLAARSRAYVSDSTSSARLTSSGQTPVLSSVPAEKYETAVPKVTSQPTPTSAPSFNKSAVENHAAVPATKFPLAQELSADAPAIPSKPEPPSAVKEEATHTIPAAKDTTYAANADAAAAGSFPGKEASYDTSTPKSGAVTPELTEGETETEDEGSEYTGTSSAPTTPRGSVVAPTGDLANGKDKKKKRKKIAKSIKKTLSKLADAVTPSTHTH